MSEERLGRKLLRALVQPMDFSMRIRLPSGGRVTVRVPYEAMRPLDEMAERLAYVRRRIEGG